MRPLLSGGELSWWVDGEHGEGLAAPLTVREAGIGPLPGAASRD